MDVVVVVGVLVLVVFLVAAVRASGRSGGPRAVRSSPVADLGTWSAAWSSGDGISSCGGGDGGGGGS